MGFNTEAQRGEAHTEGGSGVVLDRIDRIDRIGGRVLLVLVVPVVPFLLPVPCRPRGWPYAALR